MTKKEKREWREIFGNVGLSEYELKSKVMLLLFDFPKGLPPDKIYERIFDNASGDVLVNGLNRIFTELFDSGLIQKEQNIGYRLSGKGSKACKVSIKVFRKYPYETWFWLNKFELLFTRYLPIILSSLALLMSILSYLFAIQSKK